CALPIFLTEQQFDNFADMLKYLSSLSMGIRIEIGGYYYQDTAGKWILRPTTAGDADSIGLIPSLPGAGLWHIHPDSGMWVEPSLPDLVPALNGKVNIIVNSPSEIIIITPGSKKDSAAFRALFLGVKAEVDTKAAEGKINPQDYLDELEGKLLRAIYEADAGVYIKIDSEMRDGKPLYKAIGERLGLKFESRNPARGSSPIAPVQRRLDLSLGVTAATSVAGGNTYALPANINITRAASSPIGNTDNKDAAIKPLDANPQATIKGPPVSMLKSKELVYALGALITVSALTIISYFIPPVSIVYPWAIKALGFGLLTTMSSVTLLLRDSLQHKLTNRNANIQPPFVIKYANLSDKDRKEIELRAVKAGYKIYRDVVNAKSKKFIVSGFLYNKLGKASIPVLLFSGIFDMVLQGFWWFFADTGAREFDYFAQRLQPGWFEGLTAKTGTTAKDHLDSLLNQIGKEKGTRKYWFLTNTQTLRGIWWDSPILRSMAKFSINRVLIYSVSQLLGAGLGLALFGSYLKFDLLEYFLILLGVNPVKALTIAKFMGHGIITEAGRRTFGLALSFELGDVFNALIIGLFMNFPHLIRQVLDRELRAVKAESLINALRQINTKPTEKISIEERKFTEKLAETFYKGKGKIIYTSGKHLSYILGAELRKSLKTLNLGEAEELSIGKKAISYIRFAEAPYLRGLLKSVYFITPLNPIYIGIKYIASKEIAENDKLNLGIFNKFWSGVFYVWTVSAEIHAVTSLGSAIGEPFNVWAQALEGPQGIISIGGDVLNVTEAALTNVHIGKGPGTTAQFVYGKVLRGEGNLSAKMYSIEMMNNSRTSGLYNIYTAAKELGIDIKMIPSDLLRYLPLLSRESPRDPAKPRLGKTTLAVTTRFNELRQNDFAGFAPVRGLEPWLNEATQYLQRNNPQQAELLKSLVDSGHLRAGPDTANIFYGANGMDNAGNKVILIATNNNPDLAATLIHETFALSGASHVESNWEEAAFIFARPFNLSSNLNYFLPTLAELPQAEAVQTPAAIAAAPRDSYNELLYNIITSDCAGCKAGTTCRVPEYCANAFNAMAADHLDHGNVEFLYFSVPEKLGGFAYFYRMNKAIDAFMAGLEKEDPSYKDALIIKLDMHLDASNLTHPELYYRANGARYVKSHDRDATQVSGRRGRSGWLREENGILIEFAGARQLFALNQEEYTSRMNEVRELVDYYIGLKDSDKGRRVIVVVTGGHGGLNGATSHCSGFSGAAARIDNERAQEIARLHQETQTLASLKPVSAGNIIEETIYEEDLPVPQVKTWLSFRLETLIDWIKPYVPQGTEQCPNCQVPLVADYYTPAMGKFHANRPHNLSGRHQGLDLYAEAGTAIYPTDEGKVVFAGYLGGYGNTIIIKHDGFYVLYGHNEENSVKLGQRVTKDTVIARVGRTGNAANVHDMLHFEARRHFGSGVFDPHQIVNFGGVSTTNAPYQPIITARLAQIFENDNTAVPAVKFEAEPAVLAGGNTQESSTATVAVVHHETVTASAEARPETPKVVPETMVVPVTATRPAVEPSNFNFINAMLNADFTPDFGFNDVASALAPHAPESVPQSMPVPVAPVTQEPIRLAANQHQDAIAATSEVKVIPPQVSGTVETTAEVKVKTPEIEPKSRSPPTTENTYTVKKGDSLWKIWIKHYQAAYPSWSEFKTAVVKTNHIRNANLIYPEQKLIIPVTEAREVSRPQIIAEAAALPRPIAAQPTVQPVTADEPIIVPVVGTRPAVQPAQDYSAINAWLNYDFAAGLISFNDILIANRKAATSEQPKVEGPTVATAETVEPKKAEPKKAEEPKKTEEPKRAEEPKAKKPAVAAGSLKSKEATLAGLLAKAEKIGGSKKLTPQQKIKELESLVRQIYALKQDVGALKPYPLKGQPLTVYIREAVKFYLHKYGLTKDIDNVTQEVAILIISAKKEEIDAERAKILKRLQELLENSRKDKEPDLIFISHPRDGGQGNRVYAYDLALAAMSLPQDKAKKIIDAYLNIYEGTKRETGSFKGFAEYYDAYTVDFKTLDSDIISGPNFWITMSLATYIHRTGDKGPEGKYLALLDELAGLMLKLQDGNGAVKRGWSWREYVVEHNIDAYAFFKMMAELSGDKKYEQAASRVFDWLVNSAYDQKAKRFHRQVTIAGGDGVLATDAQTWAILAIGPEKLLERGINPKDLLAAIDAARVNVKYTLPDGKTKIRTTGFDFIDPRAADATARGREREVLFPEQTAWAILAYRAAGVTPTTDYQAELRKMLYQGTLPYATRPNVPTGHSFNTPDTKISLAPTLSYYIAQSGDNPFTLADEGKALIPQATLEIFAPLSPYAASMHYLDAEGSRTSGAYLRQIEDLLRVANDRGLTANDPYLSTVLTFGNFAQGLFIPSKMSGIKEDTVAGALDLGHGNFIGIAPSGTPLPYVDMNAYLTIAQIIMYWPRMAPSDQWFGALSGVDAINTILNSGTMLEAKRNGAIMIVSSNRHGENLPALDLGLARFRVNKIDAMYDGSPYATLLGLNYGRARIYPLLEENASGDYKIRLSKERIYSDIVTPSEGLNQLISNITGKYLTGNVPRDYFAMVYLSDRQRAAIKEGMLNDDSNFVYWMERPDANKIKSAEFLAQLKSICPADDNDETFNIIKGLIENGRMQLIYRQDLANDKVRLLSVAEMYYPKDELSQNKFETETYLKDLGLWMERGQRYRIPSVADFRRLAQYFYAQNRYGGWLDIETGTITPFNSLEEIPAAVLGRVPVEGRNNIRIYDKDGKPVDTKVWVNPYNPKQMLIPSMLLTEMFWMMHEGKVGEQKINIYDNGWITRHFRSELPKTKRLPADTQITVKQDRFKYKTTTLGELARDLGLGVADGANFSDGGYVTVSFDPAYTEGSKYRLTDLNAYASPDLSLRDTNDSKGRFVIIGERTLNVPQAIIRTFRQDGKRMVFIYNEEQAQKLLTFKLRGDDKITLKFGENEIVLEQARTLDGKLLPAPTLTFEPQAVAQAGNGMLLPGIVEYANVESNEIRSRLFDPETRETRYVQSIPGIVFQQKIEIPVRGINPTQTESLNAQPITEEIVTAVPELKVETKHWRDRFKARKDITARRDLPPARGRAHSPEEENRPMEVPDNVLRGYPQIGIMDRNRA
ncbi:MAG: peptidoglycan DD-metalloendopeptidase family protein, partial [Candidatus Omnitrophica bacterium]|nr:peptidoglycan DD-metalloendopeptidase family protein [Candidatus Omnitrophota bacterium]